MMQLTLKTSTGNTVKCAACFSIKRDVFDLPVSLDAMLAGDSLLTEDSFLSESH